MPKPVKKLSDITMAARKLLELAPVELEKAIDAIPMSDRQELAQELDAICQKASLVSGYLDARGATGCGDNGHSAGVREANKARTRIRAAIGFTYPKSDITF